MSHQYANLNIDELEEHFSNFLMDGWSYSKVTSFARHEKAFEMQYIYRQYGKSSSSTIAGQAYHEALDRYFQAKMEGVELTLVNLQTIAYEYVDAIPEDYWKIQKTTPDLTACLKKANDIITKLLTNFISEINTYLDEIGTILSSEEKLFQWLKVNGVDIPLPCSMKLDLVFETKDGRRIILDHKSKNAFTDEKDIKLIVGKQAITYVLGYEAKYGKKIDEVWFAENKYSKNKNGSAQIVIHKVVLDHDTRRLYEAMLYEPLKRMIEAISDPDYVFMINDNDMFVDKDEIFNFWMQTMIAEVDAFDIQESKKEMVANRLRKIRNSSFKEISPNIIKEFKNNAGTFINYDLSKTDMNTSEKIEHILRTLGKLVKVEHQFEGFSSDTFLLSMNAGLTITSIFKHRLDIANALDVNDVRIGRKLYVHEGKSFLSVESSKKQGDILYYDEKYLNGFKIPLGLNNLKSPIVWDLKNHSTPHMLMCGGTGSGKTVCIISMIESMKASGIKKIYIMDPKRQDFKRYKNDPQVELYHDIEDIETKMELLVDEMNNRFKNDLEEITPIIFDEFADAKASSRKGAKLKVFENEVVGQYKTGLPKTKRVHVSTSNSLEENLQLLLQKGRGCGFRILSATQRASVDIINGDAKVNFPVQVCFMVGKEADSRVVIDEPGAESLSGRGDGLIKSPEYLDVVRFQAFYKKQ